MNKKTNNANQKKYRDSHKKIIVERQKRYYELNKERLKLKSKKYYKENKEHIDQLRFGFLGKQLPLLRHDKCPEGYVYHHTCYDHADPEANMVLLSRSSHMKGHRLLKTLGIKIPHINMEE